MSEEQLMLGLDIATVLGVLENLQVLCLLIPCLWWRRFVPFMLGREFFAVVIVGSHWLGTWYQVVCPSSSNLCHWRVVNRGYLEDCPPVTSPRVESLGCLGKLPDHGLPSRYEVERVLLEYDILRWSSYAKFWEAVHLEAEMEWMVDTLLDTHLVSPNLPE